MTTATLTAPAVTVDLTQLSAIDLAARIARGDTTAVAAVEADIARIEQVNPALNAVVVKLYDQARAAARQADAAQARGERLGPLHGVPITVKESLDVAGTPSTFGLPERLSHRAAVDDRYVAALKAAGAIVLGKTNVSQLLIYYESDNPVYGRTNNPWNLERTPGGSSGGQAAILAAGGAALGLGTDIGGSLRVPATFSGVVSLKPTQGRTDDPGRYSVPYGQRSIVSQVGPMARTVADVALALELLNAVQTEPAHPLADYRAVDVKTLRVGYFTSDGALPAAPAMTRAVHQAAESLRRQGATVREWTPPGLADQAPHLFFAMLSADGGAGFRRVLGRGQRDPRAAALADLGKLPALLPLMSAMLRAQGQHTLAAFLKHFGPTSADDYFKHTEALLDYRAQFAAALDQAGLDVLLSPAMPLPAFTHGASANLSTAGAYATMYNVLGYPAGVVPVTRVRADEAVAGPASKDQIVATARQVQLGSAGLPVGVQVAARPWREHQALAVMAAIEAAAQPTADFPRTPHAPGA